MSPPPLTGYGLEVDLWAAGVILYILLCGFPPFRSLERDQDELFSIIQQGHFEFLAPYWDSISEGEIRGFQAREEGVWSGAPAGSGCEQVLGQTWEKIVGLTPAPSTEVDCRRVLLRQSAPQNTTGFEI